MLRHNKSWHLYYFRGADFLLVHYAPNRKTGVASNIIPNRLPKHFVPAACAQHRKAGQDDSYRILFFDCYYILQLKFSSHLMVSAMCFPEKMPSLVHQCDQNINRWMKRQYKSTLLSNQLATLSRCMGVEVFQRELSMEDAFCCTSAGDTMIEGTYVGTWYNLWPVAVYSGEKQVYFKGFWMSSEKTYLESLLARWKKWEKILTLVVGLWLFFHWLMLK